MIAQIETKANMPLCWGQLKGPYDHPYMLHRSSVTIATETTHGTTRGRPVTGDGLLHSSLQ